MQSVEAWLTQFQTLLAARGLDALRDLLRLIKDAPSQDHIDALDKLLKDGNWYGRLGSDLTNAIRSRRSEFESASHDSDPTP